MEENQNKSVQEMLMSQDYRLTIIEEIRGSENQERLEQSQAEYDVYSGNIRPYVEAMLSNRFSQSLVKEIPIVSSINILKKSVDSKASLYKTEPERDFTDLTDEQIEKVESIYSDMNIDFSMLETNRLFELQKKQTHVLIEPRGGKLLLRPIKAHQINVIPSLQDQEVGEIYIFSSYDKSISRNKSETPRNDNFNQRIADQDDYKSEERRFIVWSKDYHFVMNGKGVILSDSVDSPIKGVLPIVEISAMKDFTYWREITNDIADFCVFYNMSQSMLQQIVELQGFAQAWLKAPSELMPQHIDIGPNRILKLTQPMGDNSSVEFGYSNPSSDIAGAQSYMESLLAQFLSSQGLDGSLVSGSGQAEKFNSGVERLLAQIEKFEASAESMALFRMAEQSIWKIVKAWHNNTKNTGLIDAKYITTDFPDSSEVLVKYVEPQHLLSEIDRIEIAERKVDLGIWTKTQALAFVDDISETTAEERLSELKVVPMIEETQEVDE